MTLKVFFVIIFVILVFAGLGKCYRKYIYTEQDTAASYEFNGVLLDKPISHGRQGIHMYFKDYYDSKTRILHKSDSYAVYMSLPVLSFNDSICKFADAGDSIVGIKGEPTFKIFKKDTVITLNKYYK